VPPLPVPPFPFVEVVLVVVVAVVEVVVVVLVLVGGGVVVLVLVVVVGAVGVVVVVGAVVVGGVVVVVPPPPLSAAITTTATISPMTAATSRASAHLTPRLMPPVGGRPGGGWSGWPMRRVGSSCIARDECTDRSGRARAT
jgi:hypothetical protein